MSIKSDKWITRRSSLPTHFCADAQGVKFRWGQFDFEQPIPATVTVNDMGETFHPVTDEDLLRFRIENPWFPMIDEFAAEQVRSKKVPGFERMELVDEKLISYGVSSYGYDVRCADEFKIFTNINNSIVDPKAFDPKCFVDVKGPKCIIPPNSFALARTVEWFKIPRNVLTICLGKSTYARCGIIVNVTPLEPEWEGHVTLEFSNTTTLPAVIYADEGVAQMLFLESDEDCAVSYKDRGGKYQGQSGVVTPRMK